MPLYEYQCEACGRFSAWGVMSDPHAPCSCPACGCASPRRITAPNVALVSSSVRRAHERNERSAHEPGRTQRTGCGCHGVHRCGTGKAHAAPAATVTERTKLQRQTKRNARPWMLGH